MKKSFILLTAALAFTLAGCQGEPAPSPSDIVDPGDPGDPGEPDAPGIRTAEDFLAFAAAVNAGESTETWENEEGWVNLLADIDFAGVTGWTPVGNAVAPWASYNPVVTSGHAFTGKFDGNAHHIKNLALVDEVSEDGAHFGLFGYVGKGGVVQNFVIEESCSLTVKSSAAHSAGMIAGVLYDASVHDVTSYAPMTYQGSATGLLHMALIGGVYASEEGCTVDSVHNYGAINAVNSANQNANATAVHVAGIVGFSNAPSAGEKTVTISSCNNYGDMESQTGRTAGIVAAANAKTMITNCENRGNQHNTMTTVGGGRLGNITCITNNGSSISGCKNYGNLISTTGARVGGIISLANAGTYTGNENYGEIISDSQYRGVFFGYVNQETHWTGGKASGKLGKYNEGTYEYDLYPEAQKEKYLGVVGGTGSINATEIVYDIATGDTPVNPEPELDVEAGLRFFFIGNSFTKDAVELLPDLLKAKGITDIQLVHMYYGGRTVPEYVDGWSTVTDYHCYVCNPGQDSWTELSGKNLSLAQVALTGKWDIVTIQEHTGRSLAWGRSQTEFEQEQSSVQELVNKVKAAQQSAGGNPKLYYILSQAYHNLEKAQNTEKNFTTTDEMWSRIAPVGQALVTSCGFDGVISTGAMLQNLRTSGLNNANGLTRDGYHMDLGIARFGAACTVFETLISPVRSILLDNVVCGPSADSFSGDTWTTAVNATRAPVALHAARYAIAKPYQVTDMEGEGQEEPVDPGEIEEISISSTAELVAFATRVNNSDEAARTANVTLTADIDLSSLESWTPIGNVSSAGNTLTASSPSGPYFSGSFDGGNHTISGFKSSVTLSANQTWGLFGYVLDGTVKNLKLTGVDVSFQSSGTADAGVVVGTLKNGTVDNVSVTGKVEVKGTTVNDVRLAVGGVVGFAISQVVPDGSESTVKNCTTNLTVTADSGSNAKNGATGCHYGGIVGFATNVDKDASHVNIEDCTNDGSITARLGRSSGIVAAANFGTYIVRCTNNANQKSTMVDGRIGNITCILGQNGGLTDCVNNGSITTTDPKCTSGGFVALLNNANVFIKGGANYGNIISAYATDSSGRNFRGLLVANFSAFSEVSGVTVSGGVAKYNSESNIEWLDVTADNFIDDRYIGHYTDANKSKIKNLTFVPVLN